MKNYSIILVLCGGLLFACDSKKLEDQVLSLQSENQELVSTAEEKDASIAEFIESLSDIESNLSQIREREMSIDLKNSETTVTGDVKERIKEDIRVINELMSQNKQTIDELNTRIANSAGQSSKLKRSMEKLKAELNTQVEERDKQIALLKEDLEKMDFTVQDLNASLDTLNFANLEKEEIISNQTDQMNTAYIAAGSYKELVAENIITKEGGVLGIGRTEKLRKDFSQEGFNQIDITETTTIPIEGKKAELVTNHPTDSYMIEGEAEKNLVIIDPDRFWNSSKYLVMVVN